MRRAPSDDSSSQGAQGTQGDFGRPLEGIGPQGNRREENLEVFGELDVLSQTRADREFGTIDIEVFDAETGDLIAAERGVRPNPRTFSFPNPENPLERLPGPAQPPTRTPVRVPLPPGALSRNVNVIINNRSGFIIDTAIRLPNVTSL